MPFNTDSPFPRAFRHLYGPVTFKDDDTETALDFMKQLIQIKEEEIAVAMDTHGKDDLPGGASSEMKQRIEKIMLPAEKGDFDTARSLGGNG